MIKRLFRLKQNREAAEFCIYISVCINDIKNKGSYKSSKNGGKQCQRLWMTDWL